MALANTKSLVAKTFIILAIILGITVQAVYFSKVDQRVVAKAQQHIVNTTTTKTEIFSMDGIDLSKNLRLQYASNDVDRKTGLMYQKTLCPECGMLFIFDQPQPLSFWMKNVYIDLDIIFISETGEILNIEKAKAEPISKDDRLYPSYYSKGNAQFVLEVNQGWAEKNNLYAGSKINIFRLLPQNE